MRLGLSQTAFAALAGVTKSAQIKWESGNSSAPTAPALSAFAEAGADILYILTGKRTQEDPRSALATIKADLDEIERKLLDPSNGRGPHQSEPETEEKALEGIADWLRRIIHYDEPLMTPELKTRAENLLEIATDRRKLSQFRAADFAQMRKRREEMKASLADWLDGGPYEPNETVRNLLAMLGLEYAVPLKVLLELVEEIHTDITARPA